MSIILFVVGGIVHLIFERIISQRVSGRGDIKLGEVEFKAFMNAFRLALWQVAFTQTFVICGIIITAINLLS